MRTSTLLAVLAALMLLVACAAPVFGQSSSSSTGESSSSSAATIIASSSSSTGTSTNNNTAASSSSSSTASNNGGASVVLLSFNSSFQNTEANRATYTTALTNEIAQALGISTQYVVISNQQEAWAAINGNTYVFATIAGVSNAVTLLNNIKSSSSASSYPYLQQATVQSSDKLPTGAASTLSFGFAAVAVVFAALML